MLISLTVGKVDAGVTVLLTPDKRLIEFPSILLPPDISSGSIVDINVARNTASEVTAEQAFRGLQERIFQAFGSADPSTPVLRCRNATQTSVVLEWDPIRLGTVELLSLSLYRNGQKAGNIPNPHGMHSTKISGLAVDTEYTFHLVLRTTAGTYASETVAVRTHKMTDLSGITITMGILPAQSREALARAVERIGARIADSVRIDTTHFVTTEGRGVAWEKANETNIPVVRPEWVEACETNGRILGVTKFYLDAVRPSPTAEEAPTQRNASVSQPAPKTSPGAPARDSGESSDRDNGYTKMDSGSGPWAQNDDDDDDDQDEDDDGFERADKMRSGHHGEQSKGRVADKQNDLTLRPKAIVMEDGDDHEVWLSTPPKSEQRSPADGAGFQDIAF